jgi:UDP-glucose 4-epimerase
MKVLITGGAGFIGSHLIERLLNDGDEVKIIDDLSTGSMENINHLKDNEKLDIIIDSVMNEKLMDELISWSDHVYHLAAAVGVRLIIEQPIRTIETNVQGTEIILKLTSRYNKKVLIASTSEVYGKHMEHTLRETDNMVYGPTTNSRWSYACSKAIDEFLALAYFKKHKLPVVIVRFFNTVGPRQTGQYGMVIPNLVKQALMGQPITVYGDGKQSRSFTYVGDVVEGIIKLMNHNEATGNIFNIGNGEETTIENLAEKIKEMTGSDSEVVYIPYSDAYEEGFEDMKRRSPDISKIASFIGYEPKVDLNGILKSVIEYHQKKLSENG